MKKLYIFLVVLVFSLNISAQNAGTTVELFPSGLSFMPLKANNQEARTGVLYYPDNANLKVDIGNSINILSITSPDMKESFTAGIEFMAYAKSTNYKGYRLQIDAVDGFFGGNISYTKKLEDRNRFLSRFRFIHNSAHLVDGSYDIHEERWIQREPVPYTRDFAELTLAHEINSSAHSLKYFGGFAYSVMVRPENQLRLTFHAGAELALLKALGVILNNENDIFIAHYFNLNGIEKYVGNQQTQLGVKFGNWHKKGVVVYLSYYSGSDIFSSYYDNRVSKLGLGFQVDW